MKTDAELIRRAVFKGAVPVMGRDENCPPRCQAAKYGTSSFYQCRNTGKIERGKHWFCGVCDPIARERKREARQAAWEAKWTARDAAKARADHINAARGHVVQTAKDWYLFRVNAGVLARAVDALLKLEAEG